MQNEHIQLDSLKARILAILAAAAVLAGAFFSAKWALGNSVAIRADQAEVATLAAGLAPDDPQAHYSRAVWLEKNFTPDDVERSLAAYETAAALSPNNYVLWLDLGRARERSGDREAAEAAMRRAYALAPNYARVQWALGNALLRQGRTDEAFAEIRKAVESDPQFTKSAAGTAWQIFGGDTAAIKHAIGSSARLNAALAELLAAQKRYDEAFDVWSSLAAEERQRAAADMGEALLRHFSEGRQNRKARAIWAEIEPTAKQAGAVHNGGFETPVKIQNARAFEWQVGAGQQPQIAQTNGHKRSGENSLVFIFNSAEGKELRTFQQTAAVEPGRSYEFSIFCRAEIKTPSIFRWEAVDQINKVIGRSEPIVNSADWKPISFRFDVPADADGVILRLVRDDCGEIICPVHGNLWFDDASLLPIDR